MTGPSTSWRRGPRRFIVLIPSGTTAMSDAVM